MYFLSPHFILFFCFPVCNCLDIASALPTSINDDAVFSISRVLRANNCPIQKNFGRVMRRNTRSTKTFFQISDESLHHVFPNDKRLFKTVAISLIREKSPNLVYFYFSFLLAFSLIVFFPDNFLPASAIPSLRQSRRRVTER